MSTQRNRFEVITKTLDLLETYQGIWIGGDFRKTPHACFGPELTHATLSKLADGTWLFAMYSGDGTGTWPVGYYACQKATKGSGKKKKVGLMFRSYYDTLDMSFTGF